MKKFILVLFLAAIILKTSNSYAQVNTQDSLALVDLYNSTGGATWSNNSGWLAGPVSGWFGVSLTSNRVTGISLFFNNLTGTLPSSLGNISNLITLELSENLLSGGIPSTLGQLSNLTGLYLSFNQFSGNIPSELGSLSKLKILDLQENLLGGTIPAALDNLTALTFLNIPQNEFTFAGMEGLAQAYAGINFTYNDQATIKVNEIQSNVLSVDAGGTLSNNTYAWYKDNVLVATNVGNSNYTATAIGNYSVTVTNSIATGLTLFSDTLAITALPVKIISFTAAKQGNQNLLQWSTVNEINSSYFAVERSNDNINFTAIGNVNAKGTGNAATNYSFTDTKPNYGINYYRLRIINKDGSFNYGEIKSVKNAAIFAASIYPNPVQANINLNFNSDVAKTAQVEIVNEEGKIMMQQQIQIAQGNSTQSINAATLSNGTYYLKCVTADGETGLQFVKVK
jgi:hypothetical protein